MIILVVELEQAEIRHGASMSKDNIQNIPTKIRLIINQLAFKRRYHLFFSRPVRKAASANEARRLPLPASLLQTAYSLTKACVRIISVTFITV